MVEISWGKIGKALLQRALKNVEACKELNRHFSKETIQMANKHMKRCSTSL